jgi:hypothetical protein
MRRTLADRLVMKAPRFKVGDFARVRQTRLVFRVAAVLEDGQVLEAEESGALRASLMLPNGPIRFAASFCEQAPASDHPEGVSPFGDPRRAGLVAS